MHDASGTDLGRYMMKKTGIIKNKIEKFTCEMFEYN